LFGEVEGDYVQFDELIRKKERFNEQINLEKREVQ
jgi:hypothetical protein